MLHAARKPISVSDLARNQRRPSAWVTMTDAAKLAGVGRVTAYKMVRESEGRG
jgi:hypothetical protein